MNEIIGLILLIIGISFDVVGCIGLVRLPDIYNRLQAATKCVTLGTCMILLSVVFYTGFNAIGVKALLCIWFVLMTSPTGAHAKRKPNQSLSIRLWEGSIMDKYADDREGAEDIA